MTKDDARKKLEAELDKMRQNSKKIEELEAELEKSGKDQGADILGPRDELEYKRMIKELKEEKKHGHD